MIKHVICAFLFLNLTFMAQDKMTDKLESLSNNEQYDSIIQLYSQSTSGYSAKSLYFVGQAYYMKEDDNNCVKFMDLSIAKDPKDPAPHYIKASTLNYMSKYDQAIEGFKSAISLKADDHRYYSGLGDSYYQLQKMELSLASYQKAIEQKDCPERPYTMIAQIYSELKNNEKALEAFYIAKSETDSTTDAYLNVLFNVGLLESLKGNYDIAEKVFAELVKLDPTDYHAKAKLIQMYYHKKEYANAAPLKESLYDAYKKGLLKDNLKDMFCFDQFKWNDKLIQAYERFEDDSKKEIYNKHIFYVVNENDDVDYRIQTEHSAYSLEQGGPRYLLCKTKGATHYTYNVGFNDTFKYEDLKKKVIDVLEGKINSAASSSPTK